MEAQRDLADWDLDRVIKAYDIRGVVPDDLDESLSRRIGAAFVSLTKASSIVVGHDMRPSSPALVAAFSEGALAQGCSVVHIGLCSTDGLYYASGALNIPGAMFTASHNPAQYNGIKLCRAGAKPIGRDSGLNEMKELIRRGSPIPVATPGMLTHRDMLEDYVQFLHTLVDLSHIRPLKVVVDAGNGMGGHTVPAALSRLPVDLTAMYFELDGTFPHHEANPIEPENLRDLQRVVLEKKADIGLAFDGDADRCFVVDETGRIVDPSTLTALIAVRELERHPGSTIIHNLITSRSVPEIVQRHGGIAVRTRVGHSFIKETMASTGAVFGGEHSGHFYFKDFWGADSGLLAALHVLAALGSTSQPLSELLAGYEFWSRSGEINSKVGDPQGVINKVRQIYQHAEQDELDGLTVGAQDWWFNVRPSNTEPLLRLNVEARSAELMERTRNDVLNIIRGEVYP